MINTQTLSSHYEQMLNLTKPWTVSAVNLDTTKLRLTIKIGTMPGEKMSCPTCGQPCAREDQREERNWRHLDTMQFETIIVCRTPRISCPEHGVLSVNVPWAGAYSRFTELFERFAIDVLEAAHSVKAAAGILRLSWDQIHEIRKRAVERGLARRKDETIKHLGIDEKNFLKGHSYVSLITDLDQGRVLDLTPDRDEAAAQVLLNAALSTGQKKSVEAVAMDMWPAFMKAAGNNIPGATIVHDKYHVATYLGKAVDLVRRKENGNLIKAGKDTLKGTRYLWLTNPNSWSNDDKESFRRLAVNELKVGRAWSLKELFRHFWNYRYVGAAETFFRKWYFRATHSRLKPMIDTAKTLKRHLVGILAYLKFRITNAATEGLNSKIQIIKSNARGFRNFQNYRAAILFHRGKLSLYP